MLNIGNPLLNGKMRKKNKIYLGIFQLFLKFLIVFGKSNCKIIFLKALW